MNWFEVVFAAYVNGAGDEYFDVIINNARYLLWFTASLSVLVFYIGLAGWRVLVCSLIASCSAVALFELNPIPLSSYDLPFFNRAPHEVYAFIITVTFSVLTLGLALLKKFRTPDRIILSLALLMCSMLIYSYHMITMNGLLNYTLKSHENYMLQDLSANSTGYINGKSSPFGDVLTGMAPELPSHKSHHVTKQLHDYISNYRSHYQGKEFNFSTSGVLAIENLAYSYAYYEKDGRYAVVIDQGFPERIFKSTAITYSFICVGIVSFWSLFAVIGLYGHRKLRKIKKLL
jgi:hypothetical protein